MNDTTTTCERCGELIRPDHFGSDRECAFGPDGIFNRDNWQCPIVSRFRYLALDAAEEHMRRVAGEPADDAPYATEIRDNDERIVTLSMIEATVTSESRTLPEAVILRWYKERAHGQHPVPPSRRHRFSAHARRDPTCHRRTRAGIPRLGRSLRGTPQ